MRNGEARDLMAKEWGLGPTLSKVEAARYLSDGILPDNFKDRVSLILDPIYSCPNCDGRLCMGCIFREWDHGCVKDCPDCCENGICVEREAVFDG